MATVSDRAPGVMLHRLSGSGVSDELYSAWLAGMLAPVAFRVRLA